MSLGPESYLAYLRSDGPELRAAAAGALQAKVPGCPDWDGEALVAHVAMVHRWAAAMLRARASERLDRSTMPQPPRGEAVLAWYDEGLAMLLGALEGTDPAEEVWNWARPRETAAFWFRRMANETAVHRFDAQSCSARENAIPAELAADGVDEMLHVFLPRSWANGRSPDIGGSLHVHATDAEVEWTVVPAGGRLEVEGGHGKGDAAVRASASNLLLFLMGRPVRPAVEVLGNGTVVERWLEVMRF